MSRIKGNLLTIVCFVCISCSNNHNEHFAEVADALAATEQHMRDSGYVTASSSRADEMVKFRIMIEHDISRAEARSLVEDFLSHFENQLTGLDEFYNNYELTFDLKSQADGTILFNVKRARGEREIWWQF